MVFSYRDMLVMPKAVPRGAAFSAWARIEDLQGVERSVQLPGVFACAEEAIRHAITAAAAFIDEAIFSRSLA
jgi:hypothetical protein